MQLTMMQLPRQGSTRRHAAAYVSLQPAYAPFSTATHANAVIVFTCAIEYLESFSRPTQAVSPMVTKLQAA